jgi:acylglycerol lipase
MSGGAHALGLGVLALILATGCGSPPNLSARVTSPLPAPQGGTHEQGFVAAKDGTELFVQSWRPTEPARGVVVVVHGLMDHGSRYADFAASLVAGGFAVYAPDLRGHGHSEGIRVYVDSFEEYLDDLDLFVKLVQAKEPGKPVFVFGHSMGGAIATLYTIRKSPKLAGLVLSAAALRADVSGFKVFGTGLVAGLSPKAGVFQLDVHDFSRDPIVVNTGLADPLVYQGAAPARTTKELLGAIDDIGKQMEAVTVPLLILHGTADRVTPPGGSEELYARAKSADKKIDLYPGLFHDLLHEPERAKVTADIVDWVARRAPASSPSP